MIPCLETKRVVLRELTNEDAGALFAIFSNAKVTKYYGMPPMTNPLQANALIERFATSAEQQIGIRWAIEEKESGQVVGTIGFHSWSKVHLRAEVGYELEPNAWGKGYLSEALKTVCTYGFESMGLNRIGAIVFVENVASQNTLLRNGFEKEGLLRDYMMQENEAHDVFVYSKCKGNF